MSPSTHLIDTSILVDFFRGNPQAMDWLNGFQADDLLISIVTAVELVAGARDKEEQKLIEKELALSQIYIKFFIYNSIRRDDVDWRNQFTIYPHL
jgi:predicted nucleic acid-binding protein